jgi:hypothetical protein
MAKIIMQTCSQLALKSMFKKYLHTTRHGGAYLNLRTQDVKAGESWVWSQPKVHNKILSQEKEGKGKVVKHDPGGKIHRNHGRFNDKKINRNYSFTSLRWSAPFKIPFFQACLKGEFELG